jgi:hypothetical protein
MKEKLPNRKKNIVVISLHKSNNYVLFFYVSNQINELIFKQKNPVKNIINSLYCFVFLIPKKIQLYTKAPPKFAQKIKINNFNPKYLL